MASNISFEAHNSSSGMAHSNHATNRPSNISINITSEQGKDASRPFEPGSKERAPSRSRGDPPEGGIESTRNDDSPETRLASGPFTGERASSYRRGMDPPGETSGKTTTAIVPTKQKTKTPTKKKAQVNVTATLVEKLHDGWLYSVGLVVHVMDGRDANRNRLSLNVDGQSTSRFHVKASVCQLATGKGICFEMPDNPNIKFEYPINTSMRVKVDTSYLAIQAIGGQVMTNWMPDRVKLKVISSDQDLLKLFHSDIATVMQGLIDSGAYSTETAEELADANTTLAWAGKQDLGQLGIILEAAFNMLFTQCGTPDAVKSSATLAKHYAKKISVVRVHSRFMETYAKDRYMKTYFQGQDCERKKNVVYSKQNEKHHDHFTVSAGNTKKQDYLFVILNSFAFEHGMSLI